MTVLIDILALVGQARSGIEPSTSYSEVKRSTQGAVYAPSLFAFFSRYSIFWLLQANPEYISNIDVEQKLVKYLVLGGVFVY